MTYKASDFYTPGYVPDAQAKRCYDCAYLRGHVTWWCKNKEAIAYRGTSIPGESNCKFWAPCEAEQPKEIKPSLWARIKNKLWKNDSGN